MVVECPYCEDNVEAQEVGSHDEASRNGTAPTRFTMLVCSGCKNALLAGQELLGSENGEEWTAPERLWPRPRRSFDFVVPTSVRASLNEADRCLSAHAYLACAAMAGRALDGICRNFKGEREYVAPGLKELFKRKIIDERLFQWSELLNERREIAAHGTEGTISRDDAEDLLDLVSAVCEYVFVVSKKFERFLQRQNA